jgi:hypothetical protein
MILSEGDIFCNGKQQNEEGYKTTTQVNNNNTVSWFILFILINCRPMAIYSYGGIFEPSDTFIPHLIRERTVNAGSSLSFLFPSFFLPVDA